MENELKSCPCCESTDLKGQSISRNMLDCFQSYVTCNKCGLCQLEFNWNTRPIEDKLKDEIKELESDLATLKDNKCITFCKGTGVYYRENRKLTEKNNALLKVNYKLKLELEKEY